MGIASAAARPFDRRFGGLFFGPVIGDWVHAVDEPCPRVEPGG